MDNQIQKTLIPAPIIFQQRHTIYTERRRQASWAFNLTWGLTGITGLVGIAAVILLFSGRISEGMFTAAGGGIYGGVTVSCWRLTKDANDRLDEALRRLEEES
ncbi:MAG TPA: hypothetical protein V6D11_19640 [Waterburya sp.]|jgi:hypothetical protein